MKFARSALNSARYFWAKLDAPARAEEAAFAQSLGFTVFRV